MTFPILLILALVLIVGKYAISYYNNKVLEQEEDAINDSNAKRYEEERRIEQRAMEIRKQSYQTMLDKHKTLYGNCSKKIQINGAYDYNVFSEINVYPEKKKIQILENVYEFDKLLRVECTDEQNTTQTVYTRNEDSYAQTSTGLKSTVGRAAVGYAIGGGVGAIIGANTASKNTRIVNGDSVSEITSTTMHSYKITIYLKDIEKPYVNIQVGDNEMLKNDIVGTIEAIIASNK